MGEIDMSNPLLWVILLPAIFAVAALLLPKRLKIVKETTVLAGVLGNLIINAFIYGKTLSFKHPWFADINFSLRLYQFSGFILISTAALSFLVVLFSVVFLKDKPYAKPFYAYLLFTLTLVNGAVLADNLAVMLFFWEGILVTLFAMIMLGGDRAFKTSVKAVVIVGLSDLCMMIGIGMYGYIAKTLEMSPSLHLDIKSWGLFAFIFMMIGAISKAGSMPFHTWIPDAADNAPMPFMAFLPGALEKLLGIYLLVRICVDLFKFEPGTGISYLMMSIGALTIIFAVMMALIQKDFKRLLSYHAVSQVGYMILGIGTALPIGIIGGLFHMINNAIYKCCLFLTAGSVEKQAGTTDLKKVGGLGRKMPVTFAAFLVAAASISGFPLTNGFFSKELIFDGALESGKLFYIIAVTGAFFTAVSFLKLGHAAFLSKPNKDTEKVKEAPLPMLVSMLVLAAGCLVFGIFKSQVITELLQPVLGNMVKAGEAIGSETNWVLAGISVAVLALAVLDHLYGTKKTGDGLKSADHFHYAPVLHNIYEMAEKRYFDPYYIGGFAIRGYSRLALWFNDAISWLYDVFIVKFIGAVAGVTKKAHNDNHSVYLIWAVIGVAVITLIFFVYI